MDHQQTQKAQLICRRPNNSPGKQKTFFVLGASGYVGKTVVSHLSKTVGKQGRIIAGSRDPEKLKGSFGGAVLPGVEYVKADMGGDTDILIKVLEGVDSLLVVTPGPTKERGALALQAAKAAKQANVGFTVLVSVASATKQDTIFGKQFQPMEEQFWELGLAGCVIRLPMFMDNLMGFFHTISDKGQFYAPVSPDNSYSPVALIDVAEAFHSISRNHKTHNHKTYTLYSDSISHKQIQDEFREAMGSQNVTFIQVPNEAAVQAFVGFGFPDWQAEGVVELFKLVEARDESQVSKDTNTLKKLIGRNPTTLKKWIIMNEGAIKEVKVPQP